MRMLDKVMIIDDDPVTSLLFNKINASVNFAKEAISFYSAVDGLDYLLSPENQKQKAPEVIFLDICMPIVNGWQFLDRVNALENPSLQHTVIFMLTASSDQSDINRAKKFASVEDYIVKPLTIERLKIIQTKFADSSAMLASSAR